MPEAIKHQNKMESFSGKVLESSCSFRTGLKRKSVENDGIPDVTKKQRVCGVKEEGNDRGSKGAAATNFGNAGTSQGAITYNPGQFGERSVAIQLPTLGNTEVASRMDAPDEEMKAYMCNPD